MKNAQTVGKAVIIQPIPAAMQGGGSWQQVA